MKSSCFGLLLIQWSIVVIQNFSQSLLYKHILLFLQGAAFGFGTIAAQAGEQLAPYLHQIVPKLYRYQFDPNPKIQQAMSSIWNALVQDNKNAVSDVIAVRVHTYKNSL